MRKSYHDLTSREKDSYHYHFSLNKVRCSHAKVVTTAVKGLTGNWVIDPTDLEVVAGTGGSIVTGTNSPTTASTIGASTIGYALNGSNITLLATNSITVNAEIDTTTIGPFGPRTLVLNAPTVNLNREIKLKPGVPLSGTATTVNVGANGTVQNGVDVAAAGGTVNLAATTYTLTQTVNINKNLTVKGAGQTNTIVSGDNQVGVFLTGIGRTVAFSDLKITQGNRQSNIGGILPSGGGIFARGPVTLTNSTLSENTTTSYGGGIYALNALTLTNSTVSGNTANDYGGGIYGDDAVTLTNSTVSGNTAGVGGGGIYAYDALTLTNSTVSGNTAKQQGGGIVGYGAVTLTNSTVSGNTAKQQGGGIAGFGAVTLTNSTVSGNTTAFGGGGIAAGIGAVTLTNSTVSGNTSETDGGGILGSGGGIITNSTITNNSAVGQANGGGIAAYSSNGGDGEGQSVTVNPTFEIKNSIVAGNSVGPDRQANDLGGSAGVGGFANGGNNIIGVNNGFESIFATSSLIGTSANPVDPKLMPLGNYGGPTQTHALLPGSPAIDAGNATTTTADQRGVTPVGIRDIGAYEYKVLEVPMINPPIVNPPIVPTDVANSIVRKQEAPKLKPIEPPTSNVLCAIKKGSNASSQMDPYKDVSACDAKSTVGKSIEIKKIVDDSNDR